MILLDTSGLLAAIDASQSDHLAAREALLAMEPRLLSPFVLAEIDYLLLTRVGQQAELALLGEVARGAYRLETLSSTDVGVARDIMDQYADLQVGLADASLVVLSRRYDCLNLLTLDQRHFRTLVGRDGHAFRLLPADV